MTKSEKTHWRKLQNPEYIGSWDLDGNDKTVKILNVVTREITGIKGTTKETVLILENCKPMIVNVTNQLMIQKIYTEFIEDWVDKLITLYPTTTKVRGDKMDCIRIRNVKPTNIEPKKPSKAKITDERLETAFASIDSGDFTKEALLDKFDLNKEQKEKFDARFTN